MKNLARSKLHIFVAVLGIIVSVLSGVSSTKLFQDYVLYQTIVTNRAQAPSFGNSILKKGQPLVQSITDKLEPSEKHPILPSLDRYALYQLSNRLRDEFYKTKPEKYFFHDAQWSTHHPPQGEATDEQIQIWAMLFARQKELDVCKFRDHYDPNFFLSRRYPNLFDFGEGRYLVELYCDIGYNRTLQYFIYEPRDIKPLLFEKVHWPSLNEDKVIVSEAEDSRFLGGIRAYDPEQKILRVYGKGSGGAFDGAFSKYQWSEAEQQFLLLEFRHKSGYEPPFDPRQYPIIYLR